jgi:hypothetical protein
MKTKTTKRLLGISAILVLSFCGALAFHLYMVKKHQANQIVYAMGRIDFKEKLTPESAQSIQNFVSQLTGVQNAVVNQNQNLVVFIYQPKHQSAEQIQEKIQFYAHLHGSVFHSSKQTLESGCPVGMTNNGLTAKLVSFITKPILFD